MPATSIRQAKYFRWLEHAPDAAAERKKSGLSHQQMHDFAATPNKGLPEHKADGQAPMGGTMTNQSFQEAENQGSRRPEWMERAAAHAQNKPMSVMADGKRPQLSDAFKSAGKPGHSLHDSLNISRDEKIPQYRVRAAAKSGTPKVRRQAQAALNMENARK